MDTVHLLQLPWARTEGRLEENEYGSPAAAEGAGSSKDGFPHTPQRRAW